ncbi:unnamed protein product [Brassica oleracea var. botrytis]
MPIKHKPGEKTPEESRRSKYYRSYHSLEAKAGEAGDSEQPLPRVRARWSGLCTGLKSGELTQRSLSLKRKLKKKKRKHQNQRHPLPLKDFSGDKRKRESLLSLKYAKCCYTPFLFLDLETDWVMRRRKSFLEVFSTRFLQNCNTILWNDGFTCRPYAIAEPGFNMPCNYAETIIGNEPSGCLSEESSVSNFCISLQHLIHTINKRHLLLELLKHITACQFHANYPQRHI